jgi:hypothetical protein
MNIKELIQRAREKKSDIGYMEYIHKDLIFIP